MNVTEEFVDIPPKINNKLAIKIALSILFGITAVVGNAFILLLIVRYKSLRKNDCIYLIALLATADFITGCGCIVFAIGQLYLHLFVEHSSNRFECMIFGTVGIYGVQCSQLVTLAIAIDRFNALRKPIKYLTLNHYKTALRWMIGAAIYSLFVIAAMFAGPDLSSKPTICNAGGSVSVAWGTYWSTFSLLNGLMIVGFYFTGKRLIPQRKTVPAPLSSVGLTMAVDRQLERQRRVTKSIHMVIVVYAACWLMPNFGLFIAPFLSIPTKTTYGILSPVAAIGSGVNSSINVLIYALKHKQIRAHMLRFVSRRHVGGPAGNPSRGDMPMSYNNWTIKTKTRKTTMVKEKY